MKILNRKAHSGSAAAVASIGTLLTGFTSAMGVFLAQVNTNITALNSAVATAQAAASAST